MSFFKKLGISKTPRKSLTEEDFYHIPPNGEKTGVTNVASTSRPDLSAVISPPSNLPYQTNTIPSYKKNKCISFTFFASLLLSYLSILWPISIQSR